MGELIPAAEKGGKRMAESITIELPEDVARRAHAIAEHTNRRIEEVLLEWLSEAATDVPVSLLPNDQVLALRDFQMSARQQAELNDLLARQREGALSGKDRLRLDGLLTIYRSGMVRKAQALRVAVERGLQPPLS